MNNILAAQAAPIQAPPPWAAAHLPTGDGVLYVGAGQALSVHAPDGSDAGRIVAALEQMDTADPAIRIQGADDQPITLAQAWRQSLILQDLVLRALGVRCSSTCDEATTRPEISGPDRVWHDDDNCPWGAILDARTQARAAGTEATR